MMKTLFATAAVLLAAAPIVTADPIDDLPSSVGDCAHVAESHGGSTDPAVGFGDWTEDPYWNGYYAYVLYEYGVFVATGPCTSATPTNVGDCAYASGYPTRDNPDVGAGFETQGTWNGAYVYADNVGGVFVATGPCSALSNLP